MSLDQLIALSKDKNMADEIRSRLVPSFGKKKEETGFESVGGFESLSPPDILSMAAEDRGFEAIVKRFGRPSLLVKNGTFEIPASDTWKSRLYPTMSRLENAIRSVGRVELVNHPYKFVGTAWLIADGVVVTNRHVAELFAQKENGGFSFRSNPLGDKFGAVIDFKEEDFQIGGLELEVEDILYVADNKDGFPDLAFLKIKNDGSGQLPQPIPLFDGDLNAGQTVAVIGYPAYDDRNDAADMNRIFGNVYEVKRFAPGEIQSVNPDNFTHDCTTLGGNSGSAIIDVYTGAAVGLHFAGDYLRANFAVSTPILNDYLKNKIKIDKKSIPVGNIQTDIPETASQPALKPKLERPQPKIESLTFRKGYDSGFLGDTIDLIVPLPTLTEQIIGQAAVVQGADEEEKHILKYTNFSVVMNKVRRLAFYTATNIDGSQAKRVKRKGDNWYFDQRIPREEQVGDDLYRGSDMDRGHLTRRLDPVWGEHFDEAEGDTFFWTNCTPQHHNFNTKTWLELEDFLLDKIETKGFRASVFTGPVFGENDRPFEFKVKNKPNELILIPLQYWKVVVAINDETKKLTATAYIISQRDLISNMESVFGQFKTYQVPVSKIENLTKLDFGKLKSHDPLEGIESVTIRELFGLEEIVI